MEGLCRVRARVGEEEQRSLWLRIPSFAPEARAAI